VCAVKRTEGSNPSLSATLFVFQNGQPAKMISVDSGDPSVKAGQDQTMESNEIGTIISDPLQASTSVMAAYESKPCNGTGFIRNRHGQFAPEDDLDAW
jgi:hypothetical protein